MTNPESPTPARETVAARGKWKKFLVPAILLTGLFLFILINRARHAGSPPATTEVAAEDAPAAPVAVEVTRAAIHPMETIVVAQGILTAAPGGSARVAATAPGRVERVFVREGDRVAAGQLIATLDNRQAQAEARSRVADVSAASADAQSAELGALASQSDSTNAVAQAETSLRSTLAENKATIATAQNALRQAQGDLKKVSLAANTGDLSNAVEQAQLGLEAARADSNASTQAARNALQQEQTDLQKTLSGARPQEVAQQKQAVSAAHQNVVQAQATRDRAATEAARAQRLFDKGIWARRQLEDAQTALDVATSAVQSAQSGEQAAQEQLDLIQAGARGEDVRVSRLRVEAAQQSLLAAQKSGDAKVRVAQSSLALARQSFKQTAPARTEDVKAANLRIASARQELESARQTSAARVLAARQTVIAARASTLQVAAHRADAASKRAATNGKLADLSAAQIAASQGELRAPLAGVITKRHLDPGEIADIGTPVVEIASPDALNLVANLSADKGAGLRAGMAARVSSDTAPGHIFLCQVVSVGQIDPQTNLLSVRLAVANRGGVLKVGAFATAQIISQTRPLAVTVPKATVLSREGKPLVMVAGEDEKAHERPVKIGVESNGMVEVLSGLKANESVIQQGQYQLDDGAPIKPNGKAEVATSETPAT